MQLNPRMESEYRARHDAIWPELANLLKQAGVSDYSIYLDTDTHLLFAVLRLDADHTMDQLPMEPVMQRWWDYMADLMETDTGNKPVTRPLIPVFHLD